MGQEGTAQKTYLGSCESLPFFYFFSTKREGFVQFVRTGSVGQVVGSACASSVPVRCAWEGRAEGFFSSKERFFFPLLGFFSPVRVFFF